MKRVRKLLVTVAVTASLAAVAGLTLSACGESGPTEAEKEAAVDARAKAKKLAAEADSAETLAILCRQDLGGILRALRNLNSLLNVGLTFADYSTRVGKLSIAYGRIPFKKMDIACISPAGVKAEKAFNSYADAYDQWNDCISDLYCDTDSIEPGLQKKWRKAGRQTSESRRALTDLEAAATDARDRARQQKKKAERAEAALET